MASAQSAEGPVETPDHSLSPMPALLLAGPTAVGKSEVALELAEMLQGEIISVDSMQVYRGLDIGTAKPSAEDRARVPHHLIDVVPITEAFDAARFVSCAKQAIGQILSRGKVPILCGGTGLYFRALLEGIGQAPASEPGLRRQIESTPLPDLLAELAREDPLTYERIDRNNPRRVFRAVEVIRLTGKPFSGQRAQWVKGAIGLRPANAVGLSRAPGDLVDRIGARVDRMFQLGLLEETRRLLAQGLSGNRTAMQALGYSQVADYLAGSRTLAETVELVKIRTRQFARRQMTWFRRQLRLEWLAIQKDQSAKEVAETLARRHLDHKEDAKT